MVTLVKFWQPSNARSPIEVTELGIITLVKPLHPPNAPSPIDVTELGMDTLVKFSQQLNAFSPIEVTEYVLRLFLTVGGIITLLLRDLPIVDDSTVTVVSSAFLL
jgi:hypothetical protein